MKAYTFAGDDSGKMTEGAVPDALAAAAQGRARRAHRDGRRGRRRADGEVLRARHADAGGADGGPRRARSAPASSSRCSARRRCSNIGVQPLADAIVTYVPSPAERPFPGTDADRASRPRAPADDKRAARALGLEDDRRPVRRPHHDVPRRLRRRSRPTRPCTTSRATRRSASATCWCSQGKTQTHVPGAPRRRPRRRRQAEGHAHERHARRQGTPASRAAHRRSRSRCSSYAIEPKSRNDEDKIGPAMQRLHEEDPSIGYIRDPQTHELLLAGPGPAAHRSDGREAAAAVRRRGHPQAAAHRRTARRSPPRSRRTAATRSRPAATASSATARSRMEPLPRGSDFEFVDDIFGGSIPRQFVPAVEKGIQDTRLRGYLAGYPVVDFRVTVTDGSYHDVDSSEMAFRLAGRLAFRDGMTRARPTLLEPIMNVEVYAPSDFAGDLMGDLNSRRGRIAGMDTARHVDGHQGHGADGRDADLRADAHVHDRRPRRVPHGVLALRRGARPPARRRSSRRRRPSAAR